MKERLKKKHISGRIIQAHAALLAYIWRKTPMINHLFSGIDFGIRAFVGIMIAFFATILLMWKGTGVLPKDIGREFTHDGK
jgi:hypothetical protein